MLISPVVELGSVLKAIETAIPSDAIEQALASSKADEDRKRSLPTHFFLFDIILSLCSNIF
ncbi:hypothetical protein NUACC21_81460 [Scytonema sp. NUACC21]